MRKLAIVLVPLLLLVLIISAIGCGGDGKDSDGDGWTDAQEQNAGTDPYGVDTDGDGYWDPQDPNPLDSNIPLAGGTPTPTPESGPESDLRAMQNAVSDYMIQSNKTPTADGKIPLSGEYALIDFDASFTQGLKTFYFYPDFLEKRPRHHDEGLWRIDSRGSVSVDIDPEEY